MDYTEDLAVFIDEPVAYSDATALQERLAEDRLADAIPDTILFLEHLPVITLGRRGNTASLLDSPEELETDGIALITSTRGGDTTYHAPGQLVTYPIMKLQRHEADVHSYVTRLEEVAIRSAAGFGIEAFRRKGMTGVWTHDGKLAAIGVRLRRWVTAHGMSFNVNIDLTGFERIVPCGLDDRRVVSLASLLGDRCPAFRDVRESMAAHFATVFSRTFRTISCPTLAEAAAQLQGASAQ
jgi:lipoyl(octanoyl) transferase